MILTRLGQQSIAFRWGTLWMLFAALAFGGCGGHSLKATLNGQDPLNQSIGSRSSNPVIVRVYQLNDDVKFRQVTLEALLRDDRKALGETFVSVQEFTVHPKQSVPLKLKLNKNAKFVGVMADFFQPDKDRWRLVYPLNGDKDIVLIESRLIDGTKK